MKFMELKECYFIDFCEKAIEFQLKDMDNFYFLMKNS